jgi:hypothetical protein
VPASRVAAWSFSLRPSQRQHPGFVYSTSLRGASGEFDGSPDAAAQRRREADGRPRGATRRTAAARGLYQHDYVIAVQPIAPI